jgi:CRISPR-associated exonuclease Cas4
MAWGGLALSFLLISAAIWILLKSRRLKHELRLPAGEVIYADDGTWFQNDEVLTDPALRLAGKPDYLVEHENGLIVPVEIKSSPAPALPWPGHVMQLMAYCRLVEVTYGVRPSHGILQYKDRAFSVEYSDTLERDLLDTLQDMKEDRLAIEVNRDHNDPQRCVSCGFSERCDQSLALS